MNRKNIAKIIFILSSVVYGVLKTVLLFELYWILLKQNTEIFAIYMLKSHSFATISNLNGFQFIKRAAQMHYN